MEVARGQGGAVRALEPWMEEAGRTSLTGAGQRQSKADALKPQEGKHQIGETQAEGNPVSIISEESGAGKLQRSTARV